MKKAIIIILTCFPLIGFSQKPLFIPDTLSGSSINLTLQNGEVEFYNGFKTKTIGYNQDFLGQTIILEQGNYVTLNVSNNLSESTTLHWHGLHVSAENDGGPHTIIEPGQTWSPSFKVLDNAATYWYHPHLHEHTEEQVTRGAAGFIIVRDNNEAALELPRSYGIDDIPIVIQSKAFDTDKQLLWNTSSDDVLLINGTVDAYLDVPAQVVRLRLLNGSSERIYNLGFEANIVFHQIASDGGLLDAPVQLTRLRLVPGERAEILLDLSAYQGQSISLKSFGAELPNGYYGSANPSIMPMGSIPGYNSNHLNGNDFNVLQLNVREHTNNPINSIPDALVSNTPFSTMDVNTTRTLRFQPSQMGHNQMVNGPFQINNASFDLDVINYEIPLNNVEIWELTNMTAIAHPFHIHDIQFFVLDINGVPPPPNMRGKKDVVLVPPLFGTVRFITKFEDFAGNTPYMYHCHMLSHEDEGMMGQFIVVGNPTNTEEQEQNPIEIYPNPVSDDITLTGLAHSIIELYDVSGHLLERKKAVSNAEQFNMTRYESGIYYFNVLTNDQNNIYKVIKH